MCVCGASACVRAPNLHIGLEVVCKHGSKHLAGLDQCLIRACRVDVGHDESSVHHIELGLFNFGQGMRMEVGL